MNSIYQEIQPQQPIDSILFFTFQVIVLGAYNVGKTTLVQKFCQQITPHNIFHTICIQFAAKTYFYKNTKFRLKFWDTSGDPKHHDLIISQYFKEASAVIIVYDITSYESFHSANQWINQLYQNKKDLPILIFGNKKDLLFENTSMKNQKRQVQQKLGKQLADKVEGVFIEGCGKTDNNLQKGLKMLLDSNQLIKMKSILQRRIRQYWNKMKSFPGVFVADIFIKNAINNIFSLFLKN